MVRQRGDGTYETVLDGQSQCDGGGSSNEKGTKDRFILAIPLESEFLWAKREAKILLVSLLRDQNTCIVSSMLVV